MIQLEQVTGRELDELDDLLGGPGAFGEGLQQGRFSAMYAFVFIAERRENPELTYEAVRDYELGHVMELMEEAQSVDPTDADSGTRSQRSVGTGE